MEYPKIQSYQFIVFHCERSTGIITFPDGTWYVSIGDPCLVFESLDQAAQYCETAVQANPQTECSILDSTYQSVKRIIAGTL